MFRVVIFFLKYEFWTFSQIREYMKIHGDENTRLFITESPEMQDKFLPELDRIMPADAKRTFSQPLFCEVYFSFFKKKRFFLKNIYLFIICTCR
jgi:hypothetical protein